MKVEQISKSENSKPKTRETKRDLTSFGTNPNNRTQIKEFSKESSNAAKNNFLANVSFKGHTTNKSIHVGTSGISEGFINVTNQETGLSIKSGGLKIDSIAKSNNSSHPSEVPVYIGDPGEKISESIKQKHYGYQEDLDPALKIRNLFEDLENTQKYNSIVNLEKNAIQETYFLERLESFTHEQISKSGYHEAKTQYDKSVEINQNYKKRIEDHPWEENKLQKEMAEAEYYEKQNKSKLEEAEKSIDQYNKQIEAVKHRKSIALQRYKLTQEMNKAHSLWAKAWNSSNDIMPERLKQKNIYLYKDIEIDQEEKTTREAQIKVNNKKIERKNLELQEMEKSSSYYRTEIQDNQKNISALESLNRTINEEIQSLLKAISEKQSTIKNNLLEIEQLDLNLNAIKAKLPGLKQAVDTAKNNLHIFIKQHYKV